jgi:hypothetical protein
VYVTFAYRNRVVVTDIKTLKAVEIPQQRDQAGH